ncbi:hypothetical protein AB4072_01010 [Microvirga sp. 2MCAF38]|uniref:hypothetical protein n=1 Tax=Microvirga sp. 2MCAF38 TaxID=3232989 RepID=UPI003F980C97
MTDTPKGTITINPSAVPADVDFNDFLANYFTSGTSFKFYGGSEYYHGTLMSGEQLAFVVGTKLLILQTSEGELKYNPNDAHTLSGTATTIILADMGSATVDTTTGLLTGYDVVAQVDGVEITGVAGNTSSPLQKMFSTLGLGDMTALTGELRNYAVNYEGTTAGNIITGSAFNDNLNGGDGVDTVVYDGKRENFDIIDNGNGTYTVKHLRTSDAAGQGTDLLSNIEKIQFSDGLLDTSDAIGKGAHSLVVKTFAALPEGTGLSELLANYFTSSSTFNFYGGTDFLGTTLISGEQLVFSVGDKLLILQAGEGELKYNPTASHTLSGTATTIILANKGSATVDATTGLLTGYETVATFEGVSISGTAGNTTSLLQQVFTSLGSGNMSLLVNDVKSYALEYKGGPVNEAVTGSSHDDTLSGGGGSDTIDGGDGIDLAVYEGRRENYNVVNNGDGTYSVTHLRASGAADQGVDTIKNVEKIQFSDGTRAIADAVGNGVKSIVIDASGSSGMDLEAFIRGGFISDATGGGFPVFDNGGSFSGAEMFIGYGDSASSKYVFAHGNLEYYFNTHTVAGTINTLEFGTRGTGSFNSNGYFVGGSASLKITGLDLFNPIPGPGGTEAEIEANGAVHNFAFAYMGGQNASQEQLDKFANSLDGYAQHFIGSANADAYIGTGHDDTIDGGGGDDIFYASGGYDLVDGGTNNDRIIFSGLRDNYVISKLVDGKTSIRDKTTGATSVLSNVELARFSDADVDISSLEETPPNAPPQNLNLDGLKVTENAAADTLIGRLSATDPEGKGVRFTLSHNPGGLFKIVGNELRVNGKIDYEALKSLAVTVLATDGDGETASKAFTIVVNDVDEAPSQPVLSKTGISENAKVGATVGTASSGDPEGGNVTIKLVSNPGGYFKLVGNKLVLAKTLNYDKAQSHTVTLEAKDAGGLTSTQQIKINVIDVAKTTMGTSGNDILKGGIGIDILNGGDGNDVLNGGGGSDKLYGNAGKDKLYGGAGVDKLYGGADADTFIFKSIKDSTVDASGRDTIYDFSRKQGDKIDLRSIDANTKVKGNQAFKLIGKKDFSEKAGELRYEKIKGGVYVHGDVDGDGQADFSILLKSISSLVKSDFFL